MPLPAPPRPQPIALQGMRTAHVFLAEMMSRCPIDCESADWRSIAKEIGVSVAGARLICCLALLKCWNRMCERGITASDVLPDNIAHHRWRAAPWT